MERLTKRIGRITGTITYEGLSCHGICEEMLKLDGCSDCPINACLAKLCDYEDAEEQELLIKLPFHPNECVYTVELVCDNKSKNIDKKCQRCIECEKSRFVIGSNYYQSIDEILKDEWKIGTEIFLTIEEAETKMHELMKEAGKKEWTEYIK